MSKAIQFRNKNNEKIYPCPYFPIGYIYLSTTNIDPSTYFGGKWEQIKDRFLLTAGNTYKAGTTGGSTTHHHLYRVGWYGYYNVIANTDVKLLGLYDYPSGTWNYGDSDKGLSESVGYNSGLNASTTSCTTIARYSAGANTQDTNSLPPYLVVYAWRRVS